MTKTHDLSTHSMTSTHNHGPILICEHTGKNKSPDVLWIESGQVQAAVCFDCASKVDSDLDARLEAVCATCAQIEGIPTAAKMPDGFYDRHDGQWIRQSGVN
jgi:hypothetical protein